MKVIQGSSSSNERESLANLEGMVAAVAAVAAGVATAVAVAVVVVGATTGTGAKAIVSVATHM